MTDFPRIHYQLFEGGEYVPLGSVHRSDLIDQAKYAIPANALVANYADGNGWYLFVYTPGSSAFTVWERRHPPACHDPDFVPVHETFRLFAKRGGRSQE